MPKGDNESSEENCEKNGTFHPLAELLQQFWQLEDQLTRLKFTTPQSTPMAELMQLKDKLQHLIMILQLHSALQPNEEPVHKTMQAYTDTLHASERE